MPLHWRPLTCTPSLETAGEEGWQTETGGQTESETKRKGDKQKGSRMAPHPRHEEAVLGGPGVHQGCTRVGIASHLQRPLRLGAVLPVPLPDTCCQLLVAARLSPAEEHEDQHPGGEEDEAQRSAPQCPALSGWEAPSL